MTRMSYEVAAMEALKRMGHDPSKMTGDEIDAWKDTAAFSLSLLQVRGREFMTETFGIDWEAYDEEERRMERQARYYSILVGVVMTWIAVAVVIVVALAVLALAHAVL